MLDARAWLIWACAVLVVASSCRNPVYALIALAIVILSDAAVARDEERRGLLAPARFALVAVPLSAALSALVSHLGATVLCRLPATWPLIGGAITLESLVYGATNGLLLSLIYGAFALVNRAAAVHDLVRLTPAALHEAGIVLSIAITFLPQTRRSLARIREARAIRGQRLHGVRDWAPLVVPLLVSGLERSMGLAEAMVARGYGAVAARSQPYGVQALSAAGLLAVLAGWLALSFSPAAGRWGALLLGAGVVALAGALRLAGRGVHRTRYRRATWRADETLVAAGALLATAAVLLPAPWLGHATLAYAPYPALMPPAVHPLLALLLLGLLVPAALAAGQRQP